MAGSQVGRLTANTTDSVSRKGLDDGGEVGEAKGVTRLNEHGLTAKQEEFSRLVADNVNYSEAYRRVYSTEGMKPATVFSSASKLIDVPHVKARVKALINAKRERHEIDAARVRRHVYERLMLESLEDDSPPAARIRALELLGKIDVVGMFKEMKGPPKEDDSDAGMLEVRLRAALQKMFGVSPPAPHYVGDNAPDIQHSSGITIEDGATDPEDELPEGEEDDGE